MLKLGTTVASSGAAALLALAGATAVTAQPAPGPGETHVPYEMNVYDEETGTQSAGAHLAAPGDMYRYTYVIDDEFFDDPAYTLERALLGVHILDADYDTENGDGAPEWGAILINGEAQTTNDGTTTDLIEMASDTEMESGLPPYIYSVASHVSDDGQLILEVVNLNEEGGRDMSAEYGDFNMLRAGLHLYYSESGE